MNEDTSQSLALAAGIISSVALFFIWRRPRAEIQLLPSINQTKASVARFVKNLGKKLYTGRALESTRQAFPEERASIGWSFVAWWALASAAASALGFLLFATLYGITGPLMERQRDSISHLFPPLIMGVIAGASFGIAFGFFQWLILRKHTTHAYEWLLATVLGLILSVPLAFLAIEVGSSGSPKPYLWLAFYLMPGIMVGALQQFTLRRYYSWTWLWILPNLLIWAIFILIFSESPLILVIIPASMLVTGTISGITLRFILRRPKEKSR